MTLLALLLLAAGFYFFVGTAPKQATQVALAGIWVVMAIAVVVSILAG